MAAAFRWILLFAVTLVATALLQPFIDQFLLSVGWVAAPGKAVSMALNWLEQIVGTTAFPWVAAGTLGLAAGVWADTFLRVFDGRHPLGRAARAKALAPSAANLALDIEFSTRSPYPSTSRYPTLFSEVEVITTKLEKLGVAPPKVIVGGGRKR